MKDLGMLNKVLLVVLVVLGVAVWFTTSQVLSIIALVVLVLLGLNITGVLGSLFNKNK